MRQSLFATLFVLFAASLSAQEYSNYAEQTNRLNALTKAYPGLTTLISLTKTNGGKDIWLLTIGSGKTESKPAIAVVGGTEGNHLLGTELAIGFAENLLKGSNADSIKNLLAKTTYYVFPNMSPDAMEQYFAKLKYERTGNATETDDDRDGKLNEDGFDDLDGNGKITQMRVESPIGDYKIHPDDPRVLIKADASKGEKGKYLLLTEGIDNDKDGLLNEDGEGGIAFNKNLTYKHNTFAAGAGDYPASEKETRALLNFLYDAFNVYAIISFGSNNNLSSPVAFNPAAAKERILAGYLEPDAKANSMVSELYNKITGTKDAPKTSPAGGELDWFYAGRGIYTYSNELWTPYLMFMKEGTRDPFDNSTYNFDRYLLFQDAFVPWKEYNHPQFGKIEIGGFKKNFTRAHPGFLLESDAHRNMAFSIYHCYSTPKLEVQDIIEKDLGDGIKEVSAVIANQRLMPTHSSQDAKNKIERPDYISLSTSGKVLAGMTVENKDLNLTTEQKNNPQTIEVPNIPGMGAVTVKWIVQVGGKYTVSVDSKKGGIAIGSK